MIQNKKIMAVVGPTASGKSELAVEIALFIKKNAKKFGVNGAEIISADSRQVYKGMDIGTGKVPGKWQIVNGKSVFIYKGIKHRLIDFVNPKRKYSVSQFQKRATRTIHSLLAIGHLPIICGGTGFYVQAAIEGIIIPDVPPNPTLRGKLFKKNASDLYLMLKKLDPIRANTIDRYNPVRLVRAIEIAKAIGKVPPLAQNHSPYKTLYIGTKISSEKLRQRIHLRLLRRMRAGMIAEVKHLHAQGVSWKRMEELGLEYRYLARFLNGKVDKATTLKELESEIIHYAKRQMTWFKRNQKIHWTDNKQKTLNMVESFLSKH